MKLQIPEMARALTLELDIARDRRDAAPMLEATDPVSSSAVEPSAPAPSGASPRAPISRASARTNRLHEWAAALAIMLLLGAIVVGFYFFVRGVSL